MKAAVTTAVLILGLLAGAAPGRADSAVRYVRDWLSVPLHATPALDSPVVHRGLASGTALTLLEDDAKTGFSRVRAADGTEGWLATRYLVSEPTARLQLDKANAEIKRLNALNQQLNDQQPPSQQQLEALQADNAQLKSRLDELQTGPDGIRALNKLRKENAELRAQVATLGGQVQSFDRSRETALFRNGALAVIAGALLTLIIPRLWPKKKSEWF